MELLAEGPHEAARLDALRRCHVVGTEPEEAFDALAELAAIVCDTPIALVSLVDETRLWFKSRIGFEHDSVPRELSYCDRAIRGDDVFVVHDISKDPEVAHHPLVAGPPHLRFYAGAPLRTSSGFNLGTLCVVDRIPRRLSERQLQALRTLARHVVDELESRADAALLRHELRTPLTSIRGALGLLASGAMGELGPEARNLVTIAERNAVRLVGVINGMLDK
ncbi:MAG: GAF domain-containing protein [Acidobacteria bacterium]|nr:GAF domain-containing protein [Acidobacteriota bacterium]MBV9476111.1 GAF domain-containing protein [Acidobacteriota bacterium]